MFLLRVPAVTALAALAAFAQKPPLKPLPEDQQPIRVEVNVVNVLCSVRDKQGGLVGNLTKDDFLLREDGKPQTIKYFAKETDLPLTIGLLVDVSKSQERLIDIERQAASQFFSSVLRKQDLAFLISFGEDAELLQDYTSSPSLLRSGLDGLRVSAPVGGTMPGPVPTIDTPRGTVLYDAVYLAAHDQLHGQVGRKVLVVITDGVDEGSRLKIEDALRAAQDADAVIYCIDYSDPEFYGGGFGPFGGGFGADGTGTMKRLSGDTGGRMFRVDRKHPLADAFNQIQEEMRSQYAIGYTPVNTSQDGTFRRIDLRTRDKSLKVQARKGYFADKEQR